ncbi:MAG: hypothetical protein CO093_05095 [Alphaproteobacteria bacterium CG_4_9_14_3_um_filter_47_13]|nr:MAG: hypothetical protein CO093_05095 [Alphaproteobacteria bacterium CG_4_9_14_3_um_filter_47_13]
MSRVSYLRIIFVLIVFIALPAGAETVSLQSRKSHEKCVDLKAGQMLEYRFTADGRLDFNIHYHDGDMVHYLVQEKNITEKEGNILAPILQHYCLMWGHGKRGIRTFEYMFDISGEDN